MSTHLKKFHLKKFLKKFEKVPYIYNGQTRQFICLKKGYGFGMYSYRHIQGKAAFQSGG